MEHKCGICGSEKHLVGPYAGGPFLYYCGKCRRVIEDYRDMVIVSSKNQWIIDKFRKALKEHKEMITEIIESVKIEKGMALVFT